MSISRFSWNRPNPNDDGSLPLLDSKTLFNKIHLPLPEQIGLHCVTYIAVAATVILIPLLLIQYFIFPFCIDKQSDWRRMPQQQLARTRNRASLLYMMIFPIISFFFTWVAWRLSFASAMAMYEYEYTNLYPGWLPLAFWSTAYIPFTLYTAVWLSIRWHYATEHKDFEEYFNCRICGYNVASLSICPECGHEQSRAYSKSRRCTHRMLLAQVYCISTLLIAGYAIAVYRYMRIEDRLDLSAIPWGGVRLLLLLPKKADCQASICFNYSKVISIQCKDHRAMIVAVTGPGSSKTSTQNPNTVSQYSWAIARQASTSDPNTPSQWTISMFSLAKARSYLVLEDCSVVAHGDAVLSDSKSMPNGLFWLTPFAVNFQPPVDRPLDLYPWSLDYIQHGEHGTWCPEVIEQIKTILTDSIKTE